MSGFEGFPYRMLAMGLYMDYLSVPKFLTVKEQYLFHMVVMRMKWVNMYKTLVDVSDL